MSIDSRAPAVLSRSARRRAKLSLHALRATVRACDPHREPTRASTTRRTNYTTHPDWERQVLDATDGEGVDLVVEVGGANTLNASIACTRTGGAIVLIGMLSGFREEIVVPSVFSKQLRIIGISVGSRVHFANMVAFCERHALLR